MSRAFTKEDDAGDDIPERPVPAGPNYVTPRGLEMLKAEAEGLVERRKRALAAGDEVGRIDRDLRYLEARIGRAVVVPRGSGAEIRFGARVTVEGETGEKKTFRIVGEDEARTAADLVPWSGPLAGALLGAKAGEIVTWEGAEGVLRYKVAAVEW
jgi:transcription elongation factor GreB